MIFIIFIDSIINMCIQYNNKVKIIERFLQNIYLAKILTKELAMLVESLIIGIIIGVC
jgi:hypothetical protein